VHLNEMATPRGFLPSVLVDVHSVDRHAISSMWFVVWHPVFPGRVSSDARHRESNIGTRRRFQLRHVELGLRFDHGDSIGM
jgi:hypothetical protein